MRKEPRMDAMAAERTRLSQKNFADAADYVRDHDPPADIDPVLWAMHGAACRSMAEELAEQLADWEAKR